MTDRSRIEWTEATWNPVTGCSKVSPGCAHCYAERISLRFGRSAGPWTPANAEVNVVLHPERLDRPLRWRRPRLVFVNSMSDLFHELVPSRFIAEVFAVMSIAERHTFQVLTKRPERMRSLLDSPFFWACVEGAVQRHEAERTGGDPWWLAVHGPLPNVWLGTSIENRRWVGRADALRATPAAVRFISAEPLLGPLVADGGRQRVDYGTGWEDWAAWEDGRDVDDDHPQLSLNGIDWMIVGGESGPGARPMDPEWARALRDQAQAAGVAFFFKQWGGVRPPPRRRPPARRAHLGRDAPTSRGGGGLVTEKELTRLVCELATRYGYPLAYHAWRSDNSPAGFPDWVFLKPGRLVGLELKGDRARTDAQRRLKQAQWLGVLATVPGCSAALIQGAAGLQHAADLLARATPLTTTRGA